MMNDERARTSPRIIEGCGRDDNPPRKWLPDNHLRISGRGITCRGAKEDDECLNLVPTQEVFVNLSVTRFWSHNMIHPTKAYLASWSA